MLKAFRLPGFDVLIADELDSEPSDEEDEEDIQSVDVTNSLIYLPEHDSCFIHTLQLVVKGGFKQEGMIKKVLAKTANIVSYVRRSIHGNDILEGEKRLQAKVVTRWNSEFEKCSFPSEYSRREIRAFGLSVT